MSNHDSNLYDAYLHARYLGEHLLTAHSIKCESGRTSNHYMEQADEYLKKVAKNLGYEVVKSAHAKVEEAA